MFLGEPLFPGYFNWERVVLNPDWKVRISYQRKRILGRMWPCHISRWPDGIFTFGMIFLCQSPARATRTVNTLIRQRLARRWKLTRRSAKKWKRQNAQQTSSATWKTSAKIWTSAEATRIAKMKIKVFAKKKMESELVSTRSFVSQNVPNLMCVIHSTDALVRFPAPQMQTAFVIKLVSVMAKREKNLVNISPRRQQKWTNVQ